MRESPHHQEKTSQKKIPHNKAVNIAAAVPDKEKIFITTSELANICGVSRFTIINWVNDGKINAMKTLGGHNRISMSEVISILETQHIKREKSGQGDNISLRCWEYNEKKSCDKECANCLIFNRKVDHCFILVKQFGRERILCEGNCMDCGYFLDFFKEKGGETDARSGRSGKGKSYGKKNFFLQKISYTTGHNLNRLVSKMAKVYNSFKKGN